MAVNDFDWDLDEDQVKMRQAFIEDHKKFSLVADFPPFSINKEMRDAFLAEIRKAGSADPLEGDAYASVKEDYAEQVDEAEMYQKRYGTEVFEAQKAAAELEKIEISDPKVARLSMDFNYGD
jgi:hypothetical protein